MDIGTCFIVQQDNEFARFKEPQIKRFAQRLFYYVLFPTRLPVKGSDG